MPKCLKCWEIAVSLLLALAATPASADHFGLEGSSNLPEIDLGALIREAANNNAALVAARAEAQAKENLVRPAAALPDPTLGAEVMNYTADSFSKEPGMSGVQVSISQSIPFPGKLTKKREVAEHEKEADLSLVQALELEISRKVKSVFYELSFLFMKYGTLSEKKTAYAQLISTAQKRFALGQLSQAELLNLQVESTSVLDQELETEKMIAAALGELNHLLGRSEHANSVLGRPRNLVKTVGIEQVSEEKIAAAAMSHNPAVHSKMAFVSASSASVDLSRKQFLPDFDFKIGYTFREKTEMDAGKDLVSAMIVVSLPIWSGSKQSPELDAAVNRSASAQASLTETRNALIHEVHVAFTELIAARKRLGLFETGILPLSRQALATARSAYATGKVEYSTLIAAVNRWFDIELEYAATLQAHETAIVKLESLVGKPLKELL